MVRSFFQTEKLKMPSFANAWQRAILMKICITNQIAIPDVDISSFVNEVTHCVHEAYFGCHMHGSFLVENIYIG